jgi:origin recognition complex subunit 5
MGVSLPPDELVVALSEQWPGREPQIRQLATLLSVSLSTPDYSFVTFRKALV